MSSFSTPKTLKEITEASAHPAIGGKQVTCPVCRGRVRPVLMNPNNVASLVVSVHNDPTTNKHCKGSRMNVV